MKRIFQISYFLIIAIFSMAFSPATIAAANDKVPDEAVSYLRDRASQLGIPADTAEMLIAKIKHGEPLDSERNIPPVEVRQSTPKDIS